MIYHTGFCFHENFSKVVHPITHATIYLEHWPMAISSTKLTATGTAHERGGGGKEYGSSHLFYNIMYSLMKHLADNLSFKGRYLLITAYRYTVIKNDIINYPA